MKTGIIIVAGGSGSRMGANVPKQFLKLAGRTILLRTLEKFRQTLPESEIVVVLSEDMIEFWKQILVDEGCTVKHLICKGGAERFDSVRNGLDCLSADLELIGVQDGVRPLLSKEMILRVKSVAEKFQSAIPVVPLVDSVRKITKSENENFEQSKTLDRSLLRAVQTPQMFRAELLRKAYKCDYQDTFTDDASVVESMTGESVALCEGENYNIKITNPLDLEIAELILQKYGK